MEPKEAIQIEAGIWTGGLRRSRGFRSKADAAWPPSPCPLRRTGRAIPASVAANGSLTCAGGRVRRFALALGLAARGGVIWPLAA